MDLEQTLLLGLAAALVVVVIAWRRAVGRAGRRSRARNARAQVGEDAAERLLEQLGFVVVERQVTRSWTLWVDGEAVEASVRVDLLVEGPDGLYVAEVKTGERAPDPRYPPTRRQLLEYQMVFEPDGLLLVDVEAGQVCEIEFAV